MKITLDPGHGYKQNLGLNGYYESTGNLRACKLLKAELEKYGFEVAMTRTEDNQDPDISTQRGQVAARNGSKVFISWHSDANANASVRGVTAIRSLQRPDSVDLGQKLASAVAGVMGTPLSPYAGNDKGVWTRVYPGTTNTDYYAVIRNSVPAGSAVEHSFLIEHGFHTNQQDVDKLDNEGWRLKIVQAEAKVLAEYFGMAGGTEPPEPTEPPAVDGLHHVQVGAFKSKANADAYAVKLKKAGFQTLVKKEGDFYRVQVGAFKSEASAKAYVDTVKTAGFDAIVVKG
ncbi:N-acetylmuramoyl-L-alanine amidase [Ruminococcaceae bacterium OttesenSCG-928-D13]|nr:N-acetylmuramoyl-L-alanine amidase [Ruminococcaceae bacterium OttesenSCG-928-D13]